MAFFLLRALLSILIRTTIPPLLLSTATIAVTVADAQVGLRHWDRGFALFVGHEPLFLFGTRQALDLVASNSGTKHWIASDKHFMIIGISFRTFGDALKIIEIQLTLKT